MVSCTLTVNEPVASFPAASVAEQLTVVSPSGNVEPEAGSHVTSTSPSTASVAVAVYVISAPCGLVASAAGGADGSVNSGGMVSCTLTVNEPVASFPAASVAEQLTVVVPNANIEPQVRSHVTSTSPSTASVAVAVYVISAPLASVASWVMSAGKFNSGGVVSGGVVTVTLNEPVASFPAASVAEQLTVVVPNANIEPEAGSHVTSTSPSTASVAVAVYV